MDFKITARMINGLDGTLFMADGPDGHLSLLVRGTPEAAIRDGEDYFRRTRKFVDGRWIIRRDGSR